MKHIIFVIFMLASASFAQSSNNFAPNSVAEQKKAMTSVKADSKVSPVVELNNQAVELCLKDRCAEAVPLLRKALEIEPNLIIGVKNLGIALYLLKNYDEAIELLERVRAKNAAADAKTLVFLGESLFAVGRNAESLTIFQKALEIEPNNAVALYNYGTVLQELKQYKEAVVHYDKALALQPDSARALNNRGMTYFLMGNYGKALDDLQKALALDASIAEIHNNLGAVAWQLGRKKAAREYFLEAVRLRPTFDKAVYNLALYFQESGDREQAFQQFMRLKQIDSALAETLRKEMSKPFVINAAGRIN